MPKKEEKTSNIFFIKKYFLIGEYSSEFLSVSLLFSAGFLPVIKLPLFLFSPELPSD